MIVPDFLALFREEFEASAFGFRRQENLLKMYLSIFKSFLFAIQFFLIPVVVFVKKY